MKLKSIICAMTLFICVKGFTQTNPRMANENYMYTVLYDGFDGATLNRNIWGVEADWRRDNTQNIWVDSINTVNVNQANGCLDLSQLYSPGYTTMWGDSIITADYISGEVTSDSTFLYGSFECRVKYANQRGSWPAFWANGGDGVRCEEGGGNACEIDISEFWNETDKNWLGQCYTVIKLENNCHRYYHPAICGTSNFVHYWSEPMGSSMDDNFHVYKCVWTPDKIDFYMDNVLKNTLLKATYPSEYFPYLPLRVILSQQVPILPCWDIISPQTSSFDYVKVKKFFLAPAITVPSLICSTDTATLDVATEAINITWQLTPSSLFSTSSGTGSTANIVTAPYENGLGKITYTFQMPTGETFTTDKDFWAGIPPHPEISSNSPYEWTTIYGVPATKEYTVYLEQDIVFYDENTNTYGGLVENFDWTWYIDDGGMSYDAYEYSVGGKMYIFHEPGTFRIRTSPENDCGSTDLSAPVFVVVIEEEYRMYISPNPASGETTIEIESTKKEKSGKVIEWELEVFDQTQAMKVKTSKLKGNSTKIQTSDWMEGFYIVRAKIGNKTISKKLLVNH